VPASRQFHYDVAGAGHYGIFSGRRWREKVYPRVRDFIASHQEASGAVKSDAPAKSVRVAKRKEDASSGVRAGAANGGLNGTAALNGSAKKHAGRGTNGSAHKRVALSAEDDPIRVGRTAQRAAKRRP
jgi:hypothetical protein